MACGTNIGTEAVVRAPADGYLFLYITTANAINVRLYEKLNFNFIRDIARSQAQYGRSRHQFCRKRAANGLRERIRRRS